MRHFLVIIVNAGGHMQLSADQGSYDGLVESYAEILEAENSDEPDGDKVEVKVARSIGEASVLAKDAPINVDVRVIFLTRGMIDDAKRLNKEQPRIRVILFTGDMPKGEPIVLPKDIGSAEVIKK